METIKVKVTAEVDVRGTLMIDRKVPVGFQKMNLIIEIKVDDATKAELIKKLLKATEHCCVVFQTLKQGIPIHIITSY